MPLRIAIDNYWTSKFNKHSGNQITSEELIRKLDGLVKSEEFYDASMCCFNIASKIADEEDLYENPRPSKAFAYSKNSMMFNAMGIMRNLNVKPSELIITPHSGALGCKHSETQFKSYSYSELAGIDFPIPCKVCEAVGSKYSCSVNVSFK